MFCQLLKLKVGARDVKLPSSVLRFEASASSLKFSCKNLRIPEVIVPVNVIATPGRVVKLEVTVQSYHPSAIQVVTLDEGPFLVGSPLPALGVRIGLENPSSSLTNSLPLESFQLQLQQPNAPRHLVEVKTHIVFS